MSKKTKSNCKTKVPRDISLGTFLVVKQEVDALLTRSINLAVCSILRCKNGRFCGQKDSSAKILPLDKRFTLHRLYGELYFAVPKELSF